MFIWSKIKDEIPDYLVIIADKVTDRFSNIEILLLCLRYVRFCTNEKLSAKHFLILYTSKVDQQFRLFDKVFCYCFKKMEYTFLTVVLKHMMRHLQ